MKLRLLLGILFMAMLMGTQLYSQVTTSMIRGKVVDEAGQPLPGASIEAIHVPSGTDYGTVTGVNGAYTISGMRVGGPYTIVISFVGYETHKAEGVNLSLGVASDFNVILKESNMTLEEIIISGAKDPIFSSDRTGAATSVSRKNLESMPTISRRINDFTRLTPQSAGSSFAGQDNRLNNITVDGSYFNNSFGLAGQPGDRTGVSPISLDAIEQIQVNVAPYDVRQGNFVGAGVNTVTKSGTNDFSGSVYYFLRHENLVGRKAKETTVDPGKFKYDQFGVTLGGPIIKNKLFFFASYEQEDLAEPGTTFRANTGGQTVGGNVTRVLESDLIGLSTFLRDNFGYETGPYQGYDNATGARKFLAKIDYNLSRNHKLSLRYNHLDSETDQLVSNSSSLGFGGRRTNQDALNFKNSNYQILENIRSFVAELNSTIGTNMSNSLIVGYTFQDESRAALGSVFPMVDILKDGATYTTFGFEPFTPSNELRYKTLQLQNNLNIYLKDHSITVGVSAERYESENVFFPGSQSAYVYNSLADFYTDANDYLANPNRTTSPVDLRRFQVRWSNIPGQEKPVQPLKVNYFGIYGQDIYTVSDRINLTAGLRIDVPFFESTAFRNEAVEEMVFKDEDGKDVQYRTDKLPDANILWSPRLGFNIDVFGNKTTQIRGGSGIFTGRPAYVWISNQIGNNGIMTGFERADNIVAGTEIGAGGRPFNPDIDTYKPTEVSGEPASRYELSLADPTYRFPQIWRSNLAIDQKLPFGLIGTLEGIYSRDVNGIYYINANLAAPTGNFTGVDDRERWTATNRIISNIDNAVVLKNQNVGSSYNFAASIEKPFTDNIFFKLGYAYGVTKNTIDPGSIAFGSWNNNQHAGNPNNPGVGISANTPGSRVFSAFTYRAFYDKNVGSTTFSLFFDAFNTGVGSYVFSGDLNGDGGNSNDLIYIPNNTDEMNFQEYTSGGKTFTVDQQKEAWEAFINQDAYLSKNRGKYAERGGVLLPMVARLDLSLAHDFYVNVGGKRNTLQVRFDILNFTNMLSPNWGVSQRLTTLQPLVVPNTNQGGPADGSGAAQYRLQNFGGELIKDSYQFNGNISDVYRIQLGVRYTFN